MDISNLIEVLGQRCGMKLDMQSGGTLAMVFEGEVKVNLEHDDEEDVLHVYAVLGEDVQDDATRLALYRQMLEANLFGHDTAGASLSIDGSNGEILLARRMELGALNGDLLFEVVQTLAACAVDLKSRLFTSAASPPTGGDFSMLMAAGNRAGILA